MSKPIFLDFKEVKDNLFVRELKDGTSLFMDCRNDKKQFYAYNSGKRVNHQILEEYKKMKLLIASEGNSKLKQFDSGDVK